MHEKPGIYTRLHNRKDVQLTVVMRIINCPVICTNFFIGKKIKQKVNYLF